MLSNILKLAFALTGILVCVSASFAQSPNDQKARAYYFEADRAVGMEEYDDALSAITNAERLLGQPNASTIAMKVKIFYGQKNYTKAKTALDEFYTFEAGENLAREMASYLTKIDKAIAEENERLAAIRRADQARAEAAKQAAAFKAEQDRLAAIAAENERLRVVKLRQEQAERDRLAQLAKERAIYEKELKDQLKFCENEYRDKSDRLNCFRVGERYEFGRDGYPIDLEKALVFYGRSCDAGSSDSHQGCFRRVNMLIQRDGFSGKTKDEIYDIAKKSRRSIGKNRHGPDGVDWNGIMGQFWLGRSVPSGENPYWKKNTIVANFYNNISCEAGNANICDIVEDTAPDELHQATQWLAECKSGSSKNKTSCYAYANIAASNKLVLDYLTHEYPHYAVKQYLETRGVRFYDNKAIRAREFSPTYIYDKNCENYKYPDSCFIIAERSYKWAQQSTDSFHHALRALTNYQIACNAINPVAVNKDAACNKVEKITLKRSAELETAKKNCLSSTGYRLQDECLKVAEAYKKGTLLSADTSKALEYYVRACSIGYYDDCGKAAKFAYDGDVNLPSELEKHAEYYGKACASYPTLFCIRAGERYEQGDGVEQSLQTAKKYYKIMIKHQKKVCKGAWPEHESCAEYQRIKAKYGNR